MANGLIGAAIASGLGQGLANVGQQGMNFVLARTLAKDREESENRRLQLMDRLSTAREERGYAQQEKMAERSEAFQRGMEQERFGRQQVAEDLSQQRKESAEERAFAKETDPERIEKKVAAKEKVFDAESGLRDKMAKEEVGREVDKMTALTKNPDYIDGIKTLTSAKESPAAKAEAALKTLQVRAAQTELDLRKELVEARKAGDKAAIRQAEDALQANNDKPWEDRRHRGTLASQAMREIGHDLVRYETALNNAAPGSPEATAIKQKIAMLDAERQGYAAIVKGSLGMETAAPQAKTFNIVDPLDKSGGKPGPASIMADTPQTPAKPGTKPDLTGTSGVPSSSGAGINASLGDYLKDKGDAVASAPVEKGIIPGAQKEFTVKDQPDQPSPLAGGLKEVGKKIAEATGFSAPQTQVAKESPDQAKLAIAKKGETGPLVAENPGIVNGATDKASASVPPKQAREPQTLGEILSQLPPDKQKKISMELNRVMDDYKAGKISADRLRGYVSVELAGVDDDLARWSRLTDTVTNAILEQGQTGEAPGPQSKLDRSYESIIQAKADKYDVPPDLLRAVIQAESSFDPNAVGKMLRDGDKAKGLMQLTSGTAKDMGVQDPFDPEQNIDGGAKYLSTLLKRYNGDEEKALAAYNFGMAHVDKGEAYPAETRAYIAKINKHRGKQ
jgi:hypothetical protein